MHYFTNRRGLLRAALRPEDPVAFDFVEILTAGEPDDCGQRLVSTFLEQLDAPDAQPNLMLKVIGMGVDDDLAGELMRELIAERFTEPLAQTGTRSDDPRLAADLVATQLLALLLSGAVPAFDQISNRSRAELVTLYGDARPDGVDHV